MHFSELIQTHGHAGVQQPVVPTVAVPVVAIHCGDIRLFVGTLCKVNPIVELNEKKKAE